jgi:hypothetical protein
MRLSKLFRIVLGIMAALLGLWSCVGIPGAFLVPKGTDESVARQLMDSMLMALGFAVVAACFAYLARWSFTGRGFKRRNKREVQL